MPPATSAAPMPPNESNNESRIIRDLRGKIAAMERELAPIYAGTAVIKKKGELALEYEKYAREELIKATNSLQCE